jgi:hypothetical protein
MVEQPPYVQDLHIRATSAERRLGGPATRKISKVALALAPDDSPTFPEQVVEQARL